MSHAAHGRVLATQPRVMRIMTRYTLVLAACALACAHTLLAAKGDDAWKHLSVTARAEVLRRAQVWQPTDPATMDVKVGPTGPGAFEPNQTVRCTYVKRPMAGNTPK